MGPVLIRATIKPDATAEVETALAKLFAAIDRARPEGVQYASTRLADAVTYLILLKHDGEANPLELIPEFGEFQANLRTWLAEPPTREVLNIIGNYQLF